MYAHRSIPSLDAACSAIFGDLGSIEARVQCIPNSNYVHMKRTLANARTYLPMYTQINKYEHNTAFDVWAIFVSKCTLQSGIFRMYILYIKRVMNYCRDSNVLYLCSRWFICTKPSLTTSLKGKQGVQYAYALVQGSSRGSSIPTVCTYGYVCTCMYQSIIAWAQDG